jgi:hypothetical protein
MNKFSVLFPKISWWIDNQGWIELGADEYSTSLVRLIDEGGMCWEDKKCKDIDNALMNAEKFLETYLPERFGTDYNK